LIRYHEALATVLSRANSRSLGWEEVALEEAEGRVLYEDCTSPEDSPHWNNSAMDGFAVAAGSVTSASVESPVTLAVLHSVVAGDSGDIDSATASLEHPTAIEIMTGAPLPSGPWDAVVKIEEVEPIRDAQGRVSAIKVKAPSKTGDFVRYQGEDFKTGALLLRRGTLLTADSVLALAALGIAKVRVLKRPRIALLSTGRELVGHTEKTLKPGMIRNSTAPYLRLALKHLGADLVQSCVIPDEVELFKDQVSRLLQDQPDIILTTGAVSMGKFDFVKEALEALGARTHFHKVAIRPGKPLLFSEFENGPIVFGVPGNPISTAVGLRFFVTPYLRALTGLTPESTPQALLVADFKKPDGLRCFFKAKVEVGPFGLTVQALQGQGSALVGPLLEANAWVEFNEEDSVARQGDWVKVHSLFPQEKPWSWKEPENFRLAAGRASSEEKPQEAGRCC